MTTEIESATEQLWERWPVLSRSQRAQQFRALRTGEKADFFLELSAHDQSDLFKLLAHGSMVRRDRIIFCKSDCHRMPAWTVFRSRM